MAENNKKHNDIIKIYGNKYCEVKNLQKKFTTGTTYSDEDFAINSVLNIYIEPTNACNINCRFCARESMKRDVKFLKLEAFKNAINPLPQGTYITITGNGEPLLNKDIYEMIKYASNRGMIVSIITNGTPLTEENTLKLIESGVSRVQISFSSIDKETYEEEMQGAKYEDTLYKVLRFIRLSRKLNSNIFITVSTVMTEEVQGYAEESKQFWNSMPIDNYYEGPLLSLQTSSKAYKQTIFKEEEWKPCVIPWITLRVDVDGNVTSCPQDFSTKYAVGNINDKSILEVMNSQKATELKKAITDADMDFLELVGYNCAGCNTWTKKMGHNFCDFLENVFPTRLALVIKETDANRKYSQESIKYLEDSIEKLSKEK